MTNHLRSLRATSPFLQFYSLFSSWGYAAAGSLPPFLFSVPHGDVGATNSASDASMFQTFSHGERRRRARARWVMAWCQKVVFIIGDPPLSLCTLLLLRAFCQCTRLRYFHGIHHPCIAHPLERTSLQPPRNNLAG